MSNIPAYKIKRSKVNGYDFYYYLHIRGGAGIQRSEIYRNGGEYDFIVFYANPSEMEDCDMCERVWCLEKGIVFGEGKNIEAAYNDYLIKSGGDNQ